MINKIIFVPSTFVAYFTTGSTCDGIFKVTFITSMVCKSTIKTFTSIPSTFFLPCVVTSLSSMFMDVAIKVPRSLLSMSCYFSVSMVCTSCKRVILLCPQILGQHTSADQKCLIDLFFSKVHSTCLK